MTREMTVSQLSAYLDGVFDDEELLHDVMLSGEVVEVSYSDKHTFLTLADGKSSVRCAHFFARDKVCKGEKIALKGSVSFYGRRCVITFAYTDLYLRGNGQKSAELARLKEKLRAAGLFENRKKLPEYVLKVAVVTSADGAALRDFVRVVSDHCPYVDICVVPARVQGDGAANIIADALARLQSSDCDAIVLCRGGGSDEDLDCFNDEKLAVAVANSVIPIISAVGHEVDYTLCDFCAGMRAGTPSIAGQLVGESAASYFNDIVLLNERAFDALCYKLAARKNALDRIGLGIIGAIGKRTAEKSREPEHLARRGLAALQNRYSDEKRRLIDAVRALGVAGGNLIKRKSDRADKLFAVLAALDPKRVRSGFAAVFRDEKAVAGARELACGDDVKLVFADGVARARILEV